MFECVSIKDATISACKTVFPFGKLNIIVLALVSLCDVIMYNYTWLVYVTVM